MFFSLYKLIAQHWTFKIFIKGERNRPQSQKRTIVSYCGTALGHFQSWSTQQRLHSQESHRVSFWDRWLSLPLTGAPGLQRLKILICLGCVQGVSQGLCLLPAPFVCRLLPPPPPPFRCFLVRTLISEKVMPLEAALWWWGRRGWFLKSHCVGSPALPLAVCVTTG